jgi:hypothetical protein
VLVLNLRCTSVTLNTKKQAIDGHVQISQSNNHVFICLSSLMTPNQSSKFNKILKDNKDACEYSINQRHHCKPNKFFFFFFFSFFFSINESKWFLNYQQKTTQSSSHNQTNNQYSPQLKVDIILNVQTNACENQRQVFKLKYKGKGKKALDSMTNSSSYFLQND